MYELIAKNKRKSWIIIFGFSLVIFGLGWLFSHYSSGGIGLFIGAVIFNFISIMVSYYAGDKMVLASFRAKEIEKNDDPELFRIVENLSITAGIPMPKVYLIPDSSLNAFATGRDPEHASVAITMGLRKILTKSELEAVMAHELSHVKNFDIRVAMLTSLLLGMVVFLSDIVLRRLFWSGDDDNRSPIGLILLIISAILAPIIAQMMQLAVSRSREYLADASGVMLTRYPEAMISALQKISQNPSVKGSSQATAHLFIFPPMKKGFAKKLFATHPPIQDRIDAIHKAARIR